MRKVYLDCASTTNVHPEVYKTYINLLASSFYNVDALYDDATKIKSMMERSREAIADMLHVHKEDIIFTSGSSEANSMAVKGVALASNKKHLITSSYEHASVLNAFKQLEEVFGYEVTYLDPNEDGIISAEMVAKAIRNDTALVSIMYVNNEVGAINPVNDIGAYIKYHTDAYFQVDATQALGKLPIDLKDIDMMSFSAHKIEGLKGSGILVKKKHIPMIPLINGGQQEDGIRGGTSNALVNICFAKTLRLSLENQDKYHDHIHMLHEHLLDELLKIDGIVINSKKISVDSIVNFSVAALTSEVMLNALNSRNIMVSALSTCHSKLNTSHVLTSMKYDDNRIKHSLRVSFDYHTTMDDIDYFITKLKEIIKIYG